MNFKADFQQKTYSKNNQESLSARSYYFGVDQDLSENFVIGADYTVYVYGASGIQTTNALNGKSILTSDIQSYATNLVKNGVSSYIEYNAESWTLGVSYSFDQPYLTTGVKSTTTEVYSDIQLGDNWSLNLS